MSTIDYDKINHYLVGIFNRVLVIEEDALKESHFSDVTVKEMNIIGVIGEEKAKTASEIAKELLVTVSTVTISLNNLERKGYILRKRSVKDRRYVNIHLTEKGQILFKAHRKFHKLMVKRFVRGISDEDTEILTFALKNLYDFLEEFVQ